MTWIKASFSGSNHNCVEVSRLRPGMIGLRNSREPDGPVLPLYTGTFATMLDQVRSGWTLPDGADSIVIDDPAVPVGPEVKYTRAEWDAFILGVKAGEFDHFLMA